MPTMESAAWRAAYPGDGPSPAGLIALEDGPDSSAFRVSKDESAVGMVSLGCPNLNNLVAVDLAKLGFSHHANLVGWH